MNSEGSEGVAKTDLDQKSINPEKDTVSPFQAKLSVLVGVPKLQS